MINTNYVTPVGASKTPYQPAVQVPTAEQIASLLAGRGYEVELGERLKSGTMSQVFEATDANGRAVIVKQTNDSTSTDPTSVTFSAKGHFIDTALLRHLDGSVRVPEVIATFDDAPVTVMEDLRSDGFVLLQDLLLNGEVPPSGGKFGIDIALILSAFEQHHEFYAITSGRQEFYERGLELRMAFPPSDSYYELLEQRFTTENQQLIPVDMHPKNIFINENNTPAWINFGRSTWADRDYALPNCLAHFAIVALAGYIERTEAVTLITSAVEGYRSMREIDDDVFCKYFGCEVMHRWAGRWIEGIDSTQQKLAIAEFGLSIFERDVSTIEELCSLLED